jgi:hypothetical protein
MTLAAVARPRPFFVPEGGRVVKVARGEALESELRLVMPKGVWQRPLASRFTRHDATRWTAHDSHAWWPRS